MACRLPCRRPLLSRYVRDTHVRAEKDSGREPMPARILVYLGGRRYKDEVCGGAKFETLRPGLPRRQRIAWSQAVRV